VHHVGVMLTGEYISGPAHVRCKLIYLVNTVNDTLYNVLVAQVAEDKFICFSVRKLVPLAVDSPHPVTFRP